MPNSEEWPHETHIPISFYSKKPSHIQDCHCNLLNWLGLNLTRAHYYSRGESHWSLGETSQQLTHGSLSNFLPVWTETMLQCCFRSGWSIIIKLIMCTRRGSGHEILTVLFLSVNLSAWVRWEGRIGRHEILIWKLADPIYTRLEHRASFTWRSEDLKLSMHSHSITYVFLQCRPFNCGNRKTEIKEFIQVQYTVYGI